MNRCYLFALLKLVFLYFAIFYSINVKSENLTDNFAVKGHVSDALTGEDLIGATVLIKELGAGTVTNVYGFYSISLDKGQYTIEYSYVGYHKKTIKLDLNSDNQINIELEPHSYELAEVVIESERSNKNVSDVRMSVNRLQVETIKTLPSFMGEVDVIKALTLLPGVSSAGEGSTGLSVRGGSVDQNLILLDEASVYNAAHLMGFFSVFNSDAIKDVQIYKGGIPANYGGRLSSVIDIRMKDGNYKDYHASGGIGSISSRLTLEGPIQKDVSSFLLSGRRTYADLFLYLSNDTNLRGNQLYFYDLNAKFNYRINDNNRLYFSGYFGRDILSIGDDFKLGWGNATATVRWNHIFNNRIFSNFSVIYSNFDYLMGLRSGVTSFDWTSGIEAYNVKSDFSWFINRKNTVKFGLHSVYHSFNPGLVEGVGEQSSNDKYQMPTSNALESALYLSNEYNVNDKLLVEIGLRYSLFQNVGESTVFLFDDNYNAADTLIYSEGEFYNNYHGPEPRLGIRYMFNENQSVKAGYNRMLQYLHQTVFSEMTTPLDVWFPSSPNILPQIANQYAVGYFHDFMNNSVSFSVEAYYKTIENQIDFKEQANVILNPQLEGEVRVGDARAFGLEFMLGRNIGDFTGWISYAWSKSDREIPGINLGNPYVSNFDKPHDLSIVINYQLSKRISMGASWIYHTGKPVTLPIQRYEYMGEIVPVYGEKNSTRLPDYHRLDLSVTILTSLKKDRRWQGSWNISVYNAYNKKNPYAYFFRQNEDNPYQQDPYKMYLFGIMPAITYNFKF